MSLGRLFGCETIVDEQANPDLLLYRCTDGKMRTASERVWFEERVEWLGIGWRLRPEHPKS